MAKQYNKVLPTDDNTKIMDQFGWLPLSVYEPTKESKLRWPSAYIPLMDDEKRRSDDAKYLSGLGFSEFHAGLAETIVRYWSMKGAHIVDPFMGRATRAVVSTMLGRTYEGYEISPTTHQRVTNHVRGLGLEAQLHLADGCTLEHTADNTADLVMTCPPYWNIEEYESVRGQLSDLHTYNSFLQQIGVCGQNIERVLKPGAFAAWVCADFREGGKLRPFHADTIRLFESAGLILHDIVVLKNFSPFAGLQAGKVAAKRYTSKIHEYLLVFRKSGSYVIPPHCTPDVAHEKSKEFFEF
jgi:hypothetical protein